MRGELYLELEEEDLDNISQPLPPKTTLNSFLNNDVETATKVKAKTLKQNESLSLKSLDLGKVSSFFSFKQTPIVIPTLTELKTLQLDEEKMEYENILVDQGKVKELKVARFGRIYKRKVPSKLGYQCLQKLDGYRYCKFCNANLPLSAFYVLTKRYVCRRHHYLRVRKRLIELKSEQHHVNYATTAWFWLNSKRFILGYDKLRFDLGDIKNIFKHLLSHLPISTLKPFLIPIDFSLPLRPRNVALISSKSAHFILNFLQLVPSRPLYIALVQHLNLFPKNFDVGNPDDPWHDPNYIRTDIDVAPLLADPEYKNNYESQDKDIIIEFLKGASTPWLNCEVLPPGEAGYWKDGKPVCSSLAEPQKQ